MDLAKIGYKSYLEEGVGKLPSLQAPLRHQEARFSPKEGWALRVMKKAYRFSEKQKSYILAKFCIGQTTGQKLDAEVVSREMRRARGTDGARLFFGLWCTSLRSSLDRVPQHAGEISTTLIFRLLRKRVILTKQRKL